MTDLSTSGSIADSNSRNAFTLVLGSSSPYRRALLEKLGLPFVCHRPDVDETPQPGESPEQLVMRLALAKAREVANHYPDAMIIGSDQIATHQGQILGKPMIRSKAIEQLLSFSNDQVLFLTSLCLLDARSGDHQIICEPFEVHFRPLSQDKIERYLDLEQPFDCAGSFKSEKLGITLFRKLQGDDPNSLIGLPLIRLVDMLEQKGISLP